MLYIIINNKACLPQRRYSKYVITFAHFYVVLSLVLCSLYELGTYITK